MPGPSSIPGTARNRNTLELEALESVFVTHPTYHILAHSHISQGKLL